MTFTRFEAVTRKNLQIRDALEEIEAILEASDFTMEELNLILRCLAVGYGDGGVFKHEN